MVSLQPFLSFCLLFRASFLEGRLGTMAVSRQQCLHDITTNNEMTHNHMVRIILFVDPYESHLEIIWILP